MIREIAIDAPAEIAWSAVRDAGNVHTRLVPGFVAATMLDEGVRTVTFANGVVLQEAIVTIDEERRRIAYASIGGRAQHHNASMEVVPDGASVCRPAYLDYRCPARCGDILYSRQRGGGFADHKENNRSAGFRRLSASHSGRGAGSVSL